MTAPASPIAPSAPSAAAPAAQGLAVFDLDGTISRSSTFAAYLIRLLARNPWRYLRIVNVVPAFAAYLLGGLGRGELKAKLLQKILHGYGRAEIDAWTARFVPSLIAHGLRADALRAIETHRQRGDRLVLLSASPDLYVPALGVQLGFDETLCTGLSWRGDSLDGGLTTPNRQGAEKANCVRALKRRYPNLTVAAYGNESADLEHLALADRPLLVCGSRAARRRAAQAGIPTAQWH